MAPVRSPLGVCLAWFLAGPVSVKVLEGTRRTLKIQTGLGFIFGTQLRASGRFGGIWRQIVMDTAVLCSLLAWFHVETLSCMPDRISSAPIETKQVHVQRFV